MKFSFRGKLGNKSFLCPTTKPLNRSLGDSGCSDHCASVSADEETFRPIGKDALAVALTNGSSINSAHIGILKCNKLPLQARACHLFPDMDNKTLTSLGKLCDRGMMIILTKTEILIVNELEPDKTTMKGARSIVNGMWH